MSLVNAPSLKRTKRLGFPRNSVNHLADSSPSSKAEPVQSQTENPSDDKDGLVSETLSSTIPGARTHVLEHTLMHENIENKYMGEKELGRGEFGVTYLCMDRGSKELLACKSISKRKLQTPVDIDDVRREVAITKHLPSSGCIVRLSEACEDENAVHLVMELCEGVELFDWIVARGHYSERGAARVTDNIVVKT